MDQFFDFLRYVAPACTLIGGSFAVVQAVFNLHRRVSVVERDSTDAIRQLKEFTAVRESVVRIEENIKELLGERRHRDRRTDG